MKRRVIVWSVVLALLVFTGAYLTFRPMGTVVRATSISDFDNSLSTAYEMGTDTSVTYEMDEENNKQDVSVLYKFAVENDTGYKIHVGGIPDDKDTYVNINVMDAELNEYASFSTCGWDFEGEEVSYQTEADFKVELLGGKTYYVLLTCVSHEYKKAYEGSYNFCMTKEKSLEINALSEETTTLDVSAEQTVYKRISADKTGWYGLDACFKEKSEMEEDTVQLDLQDEDGNPVIINDGKCYLEAGMEYKVMLRIAGDDDARTEEVNVKFLPIREKVISKEKECTYANQSSCRYVADETGQIIVYSCSKSANPKITVIKDNEEITGNEDYSYGESENEKDFGVVCSVEKGQVYTLLLSDNEESGEEITVHLTAWKEISEEPSKQTQTPSGGTSLSRTPSPGSGRTKPGAVSPKGSASGRNRIPGKVIALKLKAKKKALQVSWKKVSGASGYEVRVSTSKKFKKKNIKRKKQTKKKKITIKKLKRKRIYFVKVRAYTVKNKKKVYGKWSRTVKKKVK